MATGFYLLDHTNRVQQYGATRRGGSKPSGVIVIHTAENVADQIGEDLGAEAIARYCTTRDSYGAYHRIVDADSIVPMVPFGYETWHCVPTNPHSIGISMAVRAGDWKRYGADYETRVLRNAARAAAEAVRDLKKHWGISVPIKHISGSAARSKVPGFTGHGETDPARRSDPGADFDWTRFLSMVRAELSGDTTDTTQEDDMSAAAERKIDEMHQKLLRTFTDAGSEVDVVDGVRRDLVVDRRNGERLQELIATNRVQAAAIETMAKSAGLDPKVVTAAIEKALSDITITLSTEA